MNSHVLNYMETNPWSLQTLMLGYSTHGIHIHKKLLSTFFKLLAYTFSTYFPFILFILNLIFYSLLNRLIPLILLLAFLFLFLYALYFYEYGLSAVKDSRFDQKAFLY